MLESLSTVVAAVAAYVVKLRRGPLVAAEGTTRSVAERLGLRLLQGDPSLNLLELPTPEGDFVRSVAMGGAPYGRPVEFRFDEAQVGSNHRFDGTISVDVRAEFCDFELTLRHPPANLTPTTVLMGRPEMPDVSLGATDLDARFRMVSPDPLTGVVIARAVASFDDHGFVHVIGREGKVGMLLRRAGMSSFIRAAEKYLHVLESVACALEGRDPPPLRDPIYGFS